MISRSFSKRPTFFNATVPTLPEQNTPADVCTPDTGQVPWNWSPHIRISGKSTAHPPLSRTIPPAPSYPQNGQSVPRGSALQWQYFQTAFPPEEIPLSWLHRQKRHSPFPTPDTHCAVAKLPDEFKAVRETESKKQITLNETD